MTSPKAAGARKAPATKKKTQAEVARLYGFRSGLEEKVAAQIEAHGFPVDYENYKIPFTPPQKLRHYTPDFVMLWNGIVVETKGRFLTADRTKHKDIKAQFPELDIRFVFSNSRAKLSKGSPTTYGAWCEKNGFLYADKTIPLEWLEEPPDETRLAALRAILVPR